MLNIVLPILFLLSLVGALFIVFKKFPQLVDIPEESIQNRETFFGFVRRNFKKIFSYIRPKRIRVYVLIVADKFLARFRATTLKVHNTIELVSKDIKQKSQQEKWKDQWFSHEENRKGDEGEKENKE